MLTDNKNISEDFNYFLEDVGSQCAIWLRKKKIENCAISLNLNLSEDYIQLSIFKRDSKTDCEDKP